jgi:hypothetical protein
MQKSFILLVAVTVAVAFTVPAIAAEWVFYGSARMTTFSVDKSKEVSPNAYYPGNGLGYDDRDTTWALQGNSRIGAKVKADNVTGHFEYGTGVNLRILSGAWNFGAGELLVGRNYTPTHVCISNQVFFTDNDLNGFGTLFSRKDMIQLIMGDFRLALVKPETGDIDGLSGVDYDTTIPMIEARYEKSFDWLQAGIFGGYNQYDIVDAADKDYDITTYLVGLFGVTDLGLVTLSGVFYYGQNLGLSGQPIAADCTPDFDPANDDVDDNDGYGYALTLDCKISNILSLHAGYGAVSFKDDVPGADDDEACSYYLQAVITLAKGFSITPEIGVLDYKEDDPGNDEGDVTYFGAKWMINF